MQQAARAHSATTMLASPGTDRVNSTTLPSRRSVFGGAVAIGAIVLQPSSWFTHFDAATWIERWYRAGHKLVAEPSGRLALHQNMDADEQHAVRLRAELGWPQNRAAVQDLLARDFRPARAGTYCGFVRRAA